MTMVDAWVATAAKQKLGRLEVDEPGWPLPQGV